MGLYKCNIILITRFINPIKSPKCSFIHNKISQFCHDYLYHLRHNVSNCNIIINRCLDVPNCNRISITCINGITSIPPDFFFIRGENVYWFNLYRSFWNNLSIPLVSLISNSNIHYTFFLIVYTVLPQNRIIYRTVVLHTFIWDTYLQSF